VIPALLSPATLRHYAQTPGWLHQLVMLCALWIAILSLYVHDAIDLVCIWWTSSSYQHCFFIPPLIGWLVYQRREDLCCLTPIAWPPGLIWLMGGALCWLLGDAAGLAVLRHGALILMLQGAVMVSLGPAISRGLMFPLFYAFFMVPVGSELEPLLQILTAKLAMPMLGWAGIPAHIEGIFITTPGGYFEVAEACSGAKFVIAMTAYGVLVCNVCFRSWIRRAIFLAVALVLCVLANAVRAFGTIYVAQVRGIEAAVGVDHVVYGWIFFAGVMMAMMAVAWPFFDRTPGDQGFDTAALQRSAPKPRAASSVLAGALAITIAGPGWSHVSALRGQADLARPVLPQVAGWRRTDVPMAYPWKPRFDGADWQVQGRYADARGRVVDLAIATYSQQSEGHELIGFGQGAADPDSEWVWSSPATAPSNARGETISAPGPVIRKVLTFYRVSNDLVSGSYTRIKLSTMKRRLLMLDQRAVAMLISSEEGEGHSADAAVRAFLEDLGPIEKLADESVRSR
jgi:exosortase A